MVTCAAIGIRTIIGQAPGAPPAAIPPAPPAPGVPMANDNRLVGSDELGTPLSRSHEVGCSTLARMVFAGNGQPAGAVGLYRACHRRVLRDPVRPSPSFRSGIVSRCPPTVTVTSRVRRPATQCQRGSDPTMLAGAPANSARPATEPVKRLLTRRSPFLRWLCHRHVRSVIGGALRSGDRAKAADGPGLAISACHMAAGHACRERRSRWFIVGITRSSRGSRMRADGPIDIVGRVRGGPAGGAATDRGLRGCRAGCGRGSSGDPGDCRARRFDVGDIERGIDVDAAGQQGPRRPASVSRGAHREDSRARAHPPRPAPDASRAPPRHPARQSWRPGR